MIASPDLKGHFTELPDVNSYSQYMFRPTCAYAIRPGRNATTATLYMNYHCWTLRFIFRT